MTGRCPCVSITSLLMTCALAAFAGKASGQLAENFSSFTSTAPKACKQISRNDPEDGGGIRVCPGPNGLIVEVSESDSRETVSVGRTRQAAAKEPAASAFFEPLSWTTPTIEWRHAGKDQPPVAMIQRWNFADVEDEGRDGRPKTKQMFAVSRLPPGGVCHTAFIDIAANPDALELARKAADTMTRDFKCGTDTVKVLGTPGRAIKLALP